MRIAAFSLIEVIGTLTIITMLAALLLPRIFEAINSARLSQTFIAIQTIKTAAAEHFARFGSLASSNGVALHFSDSHNDFDLVLLTEGFIDKPFASNIGTNSFIRLVRLPGISPSTKPDGLNGVYDLDGNNNNDVVGAQFTLEAVFLNVTKADALALNHFLDGPDLGENPGGNDFKGKVIYHRPTPSKPQLRVSVYISHH